VNSRVNAEQVYKKFGVRNTEGGVIEMDLNTDAPLARPQHIVVA
jgi:hypothetical protein